MFILISHRLPTIMTKIIVSDIEEFLMDSLFYYQREQWQKPILRRLQVRSISFWVPYDWLFFSGLCVLCFMHVYIFNYIKLAGLANEREVCSLPLVKIV